MAHLTHQERHCVEKSLHEKRYHMDIKSSLSINNGISNDAKPKKSLGYRLKKEWQRNKDLYLFCIPGLILIILFNYIPMYDGIMMSFKKFMPRLGVAKSPWIGLKNFEKFFSSYNCLLYFKNTLRLSFYSLLVGFPAPIIFAIMVNEIVFKRYKRIVQTISYAPNFISVVVLVGMLNMFFSYDGLVNHILSLLGAEPFDFAAKNYLFPHMYVWSGIWQTVGYSSIIYIAVLSSVDPQLVDAARIDGASKIQRIRNIDIPILIPTAIIMLIFAIGGIMNVGFEKVLLMQTPYNLEYSEVIQTYVYKVGIIDSQYSFSTAIGLFNSVVNFILLTIANFVTRRVSETSLW